MICPNCHGNIPDNSKFCTLCGSKTNPVNTMNPITGVHSPGNSNPYVAAGAASGNSGTAAKILNNIDFRHLDVKGTVTLEAIFWALSSLGWFFPLANGDTFSSSKSVINYLLEGGSEGMVPGVDAIFWIMIIVVAFMIVLGFWQALHPFGKAFTTVYASIGIIFSTYDLLLGSLANWAVGSLAQVEGGGISFVGHLFQICSVILLLLHCVEVWMLAAQGKRVS